MARYRALRGVCIGVGQHLTPGDAPVEIEAAAAQFLKSIGAIEEVVDAPVPEPVTPAKPGKKE